MSPSAPYLEEAARLLAEGDYFMAHETLEEYWIDAPAAERDLYQGLIHMAVGLLHHVRGNHRGAALQFGKATARLASYPDEFGGVDVRSVRTFLDIVTTSSVSGAALTPPTFLIPQRGK